jgi:hypothetical protein
VRLDRQPVAAERRLGQAPGIRAGEIGGLLKIGKSKVATCRVDIARRMGRLPRSSPPPECKFCNNPSGRGRQREPPRDNQRFQTMDREPIFGSGIASQTNQAQGRVIACQRDRPQSFRIHALGDLALGGRAIRLRQTALGPRQRITPNVERCIAPHCKRRAATPRRPPLVALVASVAGEIGKPAAISASATSFRFNRVAGLSGIMLIGSSPFAKVCV